MKNPEKFLMGFLRTLETRLLKLEFERKEWVEKKSYYVISKISGEIDGVKWALDSLKESIAGAASTKKKGISGNDCTPNTD